MNIYYILSILICLSAGFAFINQKYIKLPFVIGLFFLSTLLSVFVISIKFFISAPFIDLKNLLESMHIERIILDVLLGFLLFAGSLHTNWNELKNEIKAISVLSIGGVLFSTVIIAFLLYLVANLLGHPMDILYCLIFGALISPTDPIAVLGILKTANIPKKTQITIVGESLFNDGIGVVVFVSLLHLLKTGEMHFSEISLLFLQEAVGGIAMGFVFGYGLYFLLKSIDHYETEILLTIAFVMAGYSACNQLHTSGALAMVVMGLMIGNYKRDKSMSHTTEEYVHKFWELVDVILNAILFILIAFVLIEIDFNTEVILFGIAAVIVVLVSRIIVVNLINLFFLKKSKFDSKTMKIISWGGLRGGLSIALVLSLPNSEIKDTLLVATYFSVLFSIIIQGLTIEKYANRIDRKMKEKEIKG